MTAVAEGTRDGGIPWAPVNAIFPNVKVMSEAAVTAVVINHGNGGLNRTRMKRKWYPVPVNQAGGDIQHRGVQGEKRNGHTITNQDTQKINFSHQQP
jgi:hypothetical protein